jgi:16S rRNA (cytosine1407-C5)-methyltransferase
MDGRDFGRYFKEHFDKVLLDAPCSWEWTMRKDEVRWSMSIIEDLSKLQEKLILSAIESLKVWGTLVYSTCTMTPEEDEMILDFAKSQLGDAIEIVPWELNWLKYSHWITEWANMPLDKECANGQKIWPHINDTEWFFIAKIIKRKATDLFDSLIYYPAKNEEILLKGKELKILYAQIRKRFNIDKEIFESMFLVKKWSSIELRSKESKPFASLPFIQNMWIPFWNISNSFEFDFFSAQIFWKYAQINIVDLDEDQADAFKSGKDIKLKKEQCVNCSEWQVIVTFDKFVLGSSLLQKQFKLKNQVPRESIKI